MSKSGEDLKKVFIRTYGCQMNVYDSERMTDALAAAGYAPTGEAADADLILLNTCHIREKAAEKVYSELGRMRELKDAAAAAGRAVQIGVAGCVAQAEGAEIVRREKAVDVVVGPQAYQRLPELLAEARDRGARVDTDFSVTQKFSTLDGIAGRKPPQRRPGRVSAFLTIQEGCDKFCTFCVVPYTRGAEASRPVDAIVAEAMRLAESGVREVTLLGQNVNAWHGAGPDGKAWGLGRLLFRLAEIPGLDRLRYTTSHPRDMADDLVAAHRDLDALMPYLHLPVQSGSDRVLAAMNRKHTRDEYLRLVERIRAARPDIALSGDFIVGFPGETDEDFEDTMRIVEEADVIAAFSFKYSPRPGTPAATRGGQVAEDVMNARLYRLQALIDNRTSDFLRAQVGTTIEVLFERAGRMPGQLVGRSPWLVPVHVDAPAELLGTIGRVALTGTTTNGLFGDLIEAPSLVAASTLQATA